MSSLSASLASTLSTFSLSKSFQSLFGGSSSLPVNGALGGKSPNPNNEDVDMKLPWKYADITNNMHTSRDSIEMDPIQLSSYKLNTSNNSNLNSSSQPMVGADSIIPLNDMDRLDLSKDLKSPGRDKEDDDKKHESTLYSIEKEYGWKGWKTVRIIGERYLFGLLTTMCVSLLIYGMSLLKWSGEPNGNGDMDSNKYLNKLNYSIFFIFSFILFGPVYISMGFCVSYSFDVLRKSNVLYYISGISIAIIVLYSVLTYKKIDYWFYYIDALGVVILFVIIQVLFSYKISLTLQEIGMESSPSQFPPTPTFVAQQSAIKTHKKPPTIVIEDDSFIDKKAAIIAFNYTAPDVVVTIFSVLYMFFLLPIYFSIDNSIIRLGWRLLVHPIYWACIIAIARQFLTKDISTNDILLNSNIVLHTFFHSSTLGKIFVFTLNDDGLKGLTEIAMVVSALEDIIIRCVSLKRDEFIIGLFYGREYAKRSLYLPQNLQLRAAILNIQVALEFSGLISAPVFIYLFQKHRLVFHFFDGGDIVVTTLILQTLLSIGLDIISEFLSTFVETRFFHLPISFTWRWMKKNKWFLAWLIYGSLSMGLLGMVWLCCRTPRAVLCDRNDICSCNAIIASSLPSWCNTNLSNNATNINIKHH